MIKIFNKDIFTQDLINLKIKESKDNFIKKLNIDNILSQLENNTYTPTLDILKELCELSGKNTSDYFDDSIDAMCYVIDSLDIQHDKDKFKEAIERINIREKYEILARRNQE